jgi:ankyrin repeat protein
MEYKVTWTLHRQYNPSDLRRAARFGNVKLILKVHSSGVPVDAADETGRTALAYAAEYSCFEAMRTLIKLGADVNSKDKHGRTAIFFAIHSCSVESVKILIELGADTSVSDCSGYTPLTYATARGGREIPQLLKPA